MCRVYLLNKAIGFAESGILKLNALASTRTQQCLRVELIRKPATCSLLNNIVAAVDTCTYFFLLVTENCFFQAKHKPVNSSFLVECLNKAIARIF